MKELVKLRNQAAKQLGFKNFRTSDDALSQRAEHRRPDPPVRRAGRVDPRPPFKNAKDEIDAKLAIDCGVKAAELMPWHYHDPFFQESPAVFSANLDAPFQKADILQISPGLLRQHRHLPIDDVLARSDLYEKSGKSPHAFCTDIDREGDVRVLGNIVPNEYWMGTMLHELGHSVYSSKNIPQTLPYTLRSESHILTTEGVAMMFERFSKSERFLTKMGVPIEDKNFQAAAAKVQRNCSSLIFSLAGAR